jgi:hypothetical protein
MTITTRPARWENLEQITEVFWLCWTQTYASRLPDALQSTMDHERARAMWAAGLRDPGSWTLVADAVAFYRRAGWRSSGDRRVEAAFGEPEIALVRVLDRQRSTDRGAAPCSEHVSAEPCWPDSSRQR